MSVIPKLRLISLVTFFAISFLIVFGNITPVTGYSSVFTSNSPASTTSNGTSNFSNLSGSNPISNLNSQFRKSYRPLQAFTVNKGQLLNHDIKYYYTDNGLFIGFLNSKILFSYTNQKGLRTLYFNMTFKDSNNVAPIALDQSNSVLNIFNGNDANTGILSYSQIMFYNIYKNIDLRFYFTSSGVKYEFISHSGNINQIFVVISKSLSLQVSKSNVNIISGKNILNFESNLTVYDKNTNSILQSSFVQSTANSYGYNVQLPTETTDTIVIDPILFSKILVPSKTLDYLDQDFGFVIKVDPLGNIYVAGQSSSPTFDLVNAYNSTYGGGSSDAFVMKFDKNWNLLFSTFIGGFDLDTAQSLFVDSAYNIYVSGTTNSVNFPKTHEFGNSTALAPQIENNQTIPNSNIFFLKFSADGQHLLFSSIIGGEGVDTNPKILVDANNNIILAGYTGSNQFPYMNFSPSLNQQSQPLGNISNYFLAKFNANGTKLLQCTLLQPADHFSPLYMELGTNNTLIIASDGFGNLKTTSNALDSKWNGLLDVFLLRIDLTNFQILYDTFLGGSNQDKVNSLYLDQNGNIYLAGQTNSENFPTTPNVFDRHYHGTGVGWDGFVTELNSQGTKIIASTYIGGSDNDYLTAIVVGSAGCVYVTGYSKSKDYPTTANAMISNSWSHDLVIITKFSPDLHSLYYSSYLGGSNPDIATSMSINAKNQLFITGFTSSTNFPSFFRLNQSLTGSKVFVLEFYDIPSEDSKYAYTLTTSQPNAIAIFLINYIYIIILIPIAVVYFLSVIKKRMVK